MPPPKTVEEKEILIQKFREKSSKYVFDSYWNSNDCIGKWLEVKQWSVDRAEKNLRRCLEWRGKLGLDSILSENFDDVHKYLVCHMAGHDNYGRPILTVPMNECTLQMEIEAGNKDRIKRFILYIMETLLNKIKIGSLVVNEVADSKVTQCVVIFDAKGINLSLVAPKVMTTLTESLRLIDDNYPGLLHVAYIINAEKGFEEFLNFTKSSRSLKTFDLLLVCGAEREKWLPKLLEGIHPDQLLERFGGTILTEQGGTRSETHLNVPFENKNF